MWRVETPAKAIGGKVALLNEGNYIRGLTEPNDDTGFPWTQREDGVAVYPEHEGVAVWVRPCMVRALHAKCMRETHGIRTVAEEDDNYFANAKHNISLRMEDWDEESQEGHMKALAQNDAIILSTEWLRDFYHKKIKWYFGRWKIQRKYMPPLHVCRNHIDFDLWPPPVQPTDERKLRIGFMGSDSHLWDIKLAYPALKWAADNGHHVVLIGHDPQWRRFMDYEHIPWIAPGEFRRSVLPLDIGLAPLVVNNHTLGKSDIKPLEYGMSGAASIVQNCAVYNRSLRHDEHVLMAGSRDEMGMQLIRLVNDPKLRKELVLNTQQYIRENRDIRQNAGEWREAVLG